MFRGLRVLPNKLKIDKKRSRSPRTASSIFRKCPYTYCACSYTNSIRTALSIVLKNEPNHL